MAVLEIQPRRRGSGGVMLPVFVFACAFTATSLALFSPEIAPRAVAASTQLASAPAVEAADAPPPPVTAARRAAATDPTDAHFSGCRAAQAAGRYSIPASDPSYRLWMDGDEDGLACEPPSPTGPPDGLIHHNKPVQVFRGRAPRHH